MAVRVPFEIPCGDREYDSPASAYRDGVEDVGSEISWGMWEAEEAGEECYARSQENRDEMEGDCGDLDEYPWDHNRVIL